MEGFLCLLLKEEREEIKLVVKFLLNWARHYFFNVSSRFFIFWQNFYHLVTKKKRLQMFLLGKMTQSCHILGKIGLKSPYLDQSSSMLLKFGKVPNFINFPLQPIAKFGLSPLVDYSHPTYLTKLKNKNKNKIK